jgi:hypothetical protein
MFVRCVQETGSSGAFMFNLDTGIAKSLRTTTRDRVRICMGIDHASDSGGDDPVAAGCRASLMSTGFESHVEVRTDSLLASPLDGDRLGVRTSASPTFP